MKKILLGAWAALLLVCCTSNEKKWGEEIILGGDLTVLIIDGDRSEGENVEILWQWETTEAAGVVPDSLMVRFQNVDEVKFVDGGEKILVTCGGGGVALIDRATRAILFYAHCPMAHSADLLPGGRIAVALSTHERGNAVELFDVAHSDEVLFRDSLYSGHGSVWLESRQRYYALGYDELREYTLTDWDGPTPKLTLARSWTIPVEGGHDLSAISESELLITGHEGVARLNLDTGSFESFAPLADTPHVKAVNFDPVTDRLIYTKAEESWWTYNIYCTAPDKTITVPWIKIYKARPHPLHRGATLP